MNDKDFTPAQKAFLQNCLQNAIDNARKQYSTTSPTETKDGIIQTVQHSEIQRSEAENIGIFYPDMPRNWIAGDDKTYYNDVFAFTNRLCDVVASRGYQIISKHLYQCLKGDAEQ